MPCLDGVIYLFLTIGVKLGDKIGVRNTVIITFVLHFSSYIILLFATNFYLFLISMVMFGIGHAISNLAVIKNCWKYFPNNTGLVYGIIVSGAGMCSSIFTPLADFFVINPEKESVDDLGFYPQYIAMRLLRYLIIVTGILSVFGVLTIFLTFDKEKENPKDDNQNQDQNKEDNLLSIENKEDENKDQRESNPDFNKLDNIENKNDNKRLWEAFSTHTNIMFIYFCFGSFCKYLLFYFILLIFI
jgi:MFS family permease